MKNIFSIIVVIVGLAAGGGVSSAQTSYSRVVTNDHPVLYWNFDEPSGNAKEIVPVALPTTVNDLTPMANATRVSHALLGDGLNLGNAASFEVGDYFIVPNLALPTNSLASPWALEFWLQVQGDQEFQRNNYLMDFGAGGGNAPAVLYDYVGGAQPRNGLELFAGGRTGAGPVITDENWHHAMFVYYGNGTNGVADRLDIYVDGTNAAQGIRGTFNSAIALTRFVVGTSAPQFAASDGFEGNLDEIAVYNLGSATNDSQVTARVSLMASNHYSLAHSTNSYASGILADNPLLYWNFDETNGTAKQLAPVATPPVVNDLTPNGGAGRVAHAAINSGLGLGMAANIPKGGYFSIGQIAFPNGAIPVPWVMEYWMQATGSQDAQRNNYIMNFGANYPAVLYDYVGGAQPRDGLELFGGGGRSGAGPLVTDANWHHLVFAYYGNGTVGLADRLDVYLDGTNAAQNVRATFGVSTLPLSSLVVGTSGAQYALPDGFQGNLDEIAMYDFSSLATEQAMTDRVTDLAARHFAAAQAPYLSIGQSGGQLALTWKASFTNLALQATGSLTATNWLPVNSAPVITNGVETVTVPVTGQAQFFRLR